MAEAALFLSGFVLYSKDKCLEWWMGGIVGLSEVRDQTKSITISFSLDLLVVTQFSGVIFFPVIFILSPIFFCLCPQCRTLSSC